MTSAQGELRFSNSDGAWYALSARGLKLLPALLGAVTVGAVAASDGGYFPNVYAWTSLGVLWVALLALVLRSDVSFGALSLVLIGALVLFVGWSALSLFWTASVTLTMLDVQKLLVYAGIVPAALLLVKRQDIPQLLAGVLSGITLVSAYALATRLFPERLGSFDPLSGYRLTGSVGYWNALGILSGLGVVLAVGFAARAVRPSWRGVSAALLPLLMTTFFFTFSRGSWIALVAGLLAACALDPRRLQLLAALVVFAPWPALAVVVGYHSKALTTITSSLGDASHQGHRLALWIIVLSLAAAATAFAFGLLESRVQVPGAARLAFVGALGTVAIVGLVLVWSHWGSPPTLVSKAYDSLLAPPKAAGPDVSHRLLDLSSNGRTELWRVAWHDFTSDPLGGRGAGTFRQSWAEHRPVASKALDAHSLYLQTLAELGVVGLAVLLAGLLAPVIAAVKARRRPFVSIAFGAYVAFLLHAGVDWDWQLTGIGAAGLLCAVALVGSSGSVSLMVRLAPAARVAAAVLVLSLASFAFVSVMANVPLHSAQAAAGVGDWAASASAARKAKRWAPWSSQPWRLLGEAQLAQGDIFSARRSFRTAVAKDPDDWELWIDLGIASTGAEQRRALATAVRLNPRDLSIRELAGRQLIRRPM